MVESPWGHDAVSSEQGLLSADPLLLLVKVAWGTGGVGETMETYSAEVLRIVLRNNWALEVAVNSFQTAQSLRAWVVVMFENPESHVVSADHGKAARGNSSGL